MNIQLDRRRKVPVYVQIINQIKSQIICGELPAGSSLPSERVLAQLLGIHRNTVVKAYSELKADGLIQSKQGVGYVVSVGEQDATGSPLWTDTETDSAGGERGKRVNWVAQIKKEHLDMERAFDDLFMRNNDEHTYSLGGGFAQSGIFDRNKLARDISALIVSEHADRCFYTPYRGDKILRQKLVSFLSTKGIKASVSSIQVLTETNQALNYIVTLLVRPGDMVMMEEPVSPDVYRTIQLAGGRVCSVPVDENGMDCAVLEKLIRQNRPQFIFVNSSFHDPTGVVLSLERRKKLIEISNKYRIPIIEEDAASELVYDGPDILPVKALDTLGNVIYIYSFSLTFVPGLALAFVVADKSVIESLSYLTSVRMEVTDWLTQKLAAMYLGDGTYYAALDAFRESYGRKQRLVCGRLDEMQDWGVDYQKPRGGVYIWCRLPDGVDSKTLVGRAYGKGLTLMPGYVFYPDKKEGRGHIRISYSYEPEDRLARGMDLLKETLWEILQEKLAHEK